MNSTKLFLFLALSVAATLAYKDTNKDCNNKNSANTTYTRTNGDVCTCDGPTKFLGIPINTDTAQCQQASTTPAPTTATTATTATTPTTASPAYTETNKDCNNKDSGNKTYTKTNGDTCTCQGPIFVMVLGINITLTRDTANCTRKATEATTASTTAATTTVPTTTAESTTTTVTTPATTTTATTPTTATTTTATTPTTPTTATTPTTGTPATTPTLPAESTVVTGA